MAVPCVIIVMERFTFSQKRGQEVVEALMRREKIRCGMLIRDRGEMSISHKLSSKCKPNPRKFMRFKLYFSESDKEGLVAMEIHS